MASMSMGSDPSWVPGLTRMGESEEVFFIGGQKYSLVQLFRWGVLRNLMASALAVGVPAMSVIAAAAVD
jgi:hypothetical protein